MASDPPATGLAFTPATSKAVLARAAKQACHAVMMLQQTCITENRPGLAVDLREALRVVAHVSYLVNGLDDERASAPAARGHGKLVERCLEVIRGGTTAFFAVVETVQASWRPAHEAPHDHAIRMALHLLVDQKVLLREEREWPQGGKAMHYVFAKPEGVDGQA